jgi:hypothetical protein
MAGALYSIGSMFFATIPGAVGHLILAALQLLLAFTT